MVAMVDVGPEIENVQQANDNDIQEFTVIGRVCHKRQLSKWALFVDLTAVEPVVQSPLMSDEYLKSHEYLDTLNQRELCSLAARCQ